MFVLLKGEGSMIKGKSLKLIKMVVEVIMKENDLIKIEIELKKLNNKLIERK